MVQGQVCVFLLAADKTSNNVKKKKKITPPFEKALKCFGGKNYISDQLPLTEYYVGFLMIFL